MTCTSTQARDCAKCGNEAAGNVDWYPGWMCRNCDDTPAGECLHCKRTLRAAEGFYELTSQPAGHMWRVCSFPCLSALVKGCGQ